MCLGRSVFEELSRRGCVASYFKFEDLQILKSIESVDSLRSFFEQRGLPSISLSNDPATIVDALYREHRKCLRKQLIRDLISDLLLLGLPRLFSWLSRTKRGNQDTPKRARDAGRH